MSGYDFEYYCRFIKSWRTMEDLRFRKMIFKELKKSLNCSYSEIVELAKKDIEKYKRLYPGEL